MLSLLINFFRVAKESRIVIVTRASEPVLAAYNGDVEEFPIIQIPEEKIIDTNGAGDAFVGGTELFFNISLFRVSFPVCSGQIS